MARRQLLLASGFVQSEFDYVLNLTKFLNTTLKEYNETRADTSKALCDRLSLAGNFGYFLGKAFGK